MTTIKTIIITAIATSILFITGSSTYAKSQTVNTSGVLPQMIPTLPQIFINQQPIETIKEATPVTPIVKVVSTTTAIEKFNPEQLTVEERLTALEDRVSVLEDNQK